VACMMACLVTTFTHNPVTHTPATDGPGPSLCSSWWTLKLRRLLLKVPTAGAVARLQPGTLISAHSQPV
jgi:hypothetical protein